MIVRAFSGLGGAAVLKVRESPVKLVSRRSVSAVVETEHKRQQWAKNEKARHQLGGIGPSSCPSWARTRTLLIQSPPAWAGYSDNLLGFGHFPSIGARFPAVVCPLVPGETTAKLRRWS